MPQFASMMIYKLVRNGIMDPFLGLKVNGVTSYQLGLTKHLSELGLTKQMQNLQLTK